jgi:hypothetical protein
MWCQDQGSLSRGGPAASPATYNAHSMHFWQSHVWICNRLQMGALEICRRLEDCAVVKATLCVAWVGKCVAVMTIPCMIMAHRALQALRVTTALKTMRAYGRLHQILMTLSCFLVPLASHVALWVSSHAQVLHKLNPTFCSFALLKGAENLLNVCHSRF